MISDANEAKLNKEEETDNSKNIIQAKGNNEKNENKEELLICNDDEAQLLSENKKSENKANYENLEENNQAEKEQQSNIVVRTIESFACLIRTIYYYILPGIQRFPFVCFLLTLAISFYHSKFIVSLVEDVSNKTGISASFFGITLISWAGNVGDSINASTAAKAKKVDLLTTGILASQIMNLQICLGLPWIIAMINNKLENKGDLLIDFGKENVIKLFLPLLFVVLVSVFIVVVFSRVLNKKSGFWFMVVYVVYFVYESFNSKKAE